MKELYEFCKALLIPMAILFGSVVLSVVFFAAIVYSVLLLEYLL
jgi:hypothetical protein